MYSVNWNTEFAQPRHHGEYSSYSIYSNSSFATFFEAFRSQKERNTIPREVKAGMGQRRNVIKNSVKLKNVWERQGKNSESVWVYVTSTDKYMCKWERTDVLLLEMHPNDVNSFSWKLIDASKQSTDADSPPETPVIVGNGGHAKAWARNVLFCNKCPSCEFALGHEYAWSDAWYWKYHTACTL